MWANLTRVWWDISSSALSTLKKLDIMKAKLLRKLNAEDVLKLDTEDGHHCSKCGYKMNEEICELFDLSIKRIRFPWKIKFL